MNWDKLDERLEKFENRQQLFISQRLEYHSGNTDKNIKKTNEKIDDLREEHENKFNVLEKKVDETKAASQNAHTEILARLDRLENLAIDQR